MRCYGSGLTFMSLESELSRSFRVLCHGLYALMLMIPTRANLSYQDFILFLY